MQLNVKVYFFLSLKFKIVAINSIPCKITVWNLVLIFFYVVICLFVCFLSYCTVRFRSCVCKST